MKLKINLYYLFKYFINYLVKIILLFIREDWRYVFIVAVCITFVSGVIILIFYHESLAYNLINKDYDKFYNSLKYIAKNNNREKEFEEGINNNEEYKQCLEQLKSYTIEDKKEEEDEKEAKVNKIEEKKVPNSDDDLNLNDIRLDTNNGFNEESGKNEKKNNNTNTYSKKIKR